MLTDFPPGLAILDSQTILGFLLYPLDLSRRMGRVAHKVLF